MPTLFDAFERTDSAPGNHSEPEFEYLNRSGRPQVQLVREFFEAWYSKLPESSKSDVRSRFRSPDNRQHLGAVLELYCFALLIKQGFTVQVHPPSTKSTQPDFLALKDTVPAFFLECTIVLDSNVDHASESRQKQVYDTLNRLKSPNFFLGLKVTKAPSKPPAGSRFRKMLERELSKLDPNQIQSAIDEKGIDGVPHWTMEDAGWTVTFFPIPKGKNVRGREGIRPLGVVLSGVHQIEASTKLRDSLVEKAKSYGVLPHPYVIAVNSLDTWADEDDFADALLGSIGGYAKDSEGKISLEFAREVNGLWVGKSGPRNSVSGVLAMMGLTAPAAARVNPVLWHNPWASNPLPMDFWRTDQMVPDLSSSTHKKREGTSGRSILSLAESWPRVSLEAEK